MSEAKTVLVTGASGFIGKSLCRRLQQSGHFVRAQMRSPREGPWDDVISFDLKNDDIPEAAFEDVNSVFHLAGKAHAVDEGPETEGQYDVINFRGTKLLLQAAEKAHVKKFIYFSSIKAMGEGGYDAQDERAPCLPITAYGKSKLAAENEVLSYSSQFHTCVLRPAMVYGPDNPGNLKRMIGAIKRGYFPPWPDTGNRRSMVHVEDMVEAALLAADIPVASGRTYIVTDNNIYSTRQIYIWICTLIKGKVPKWSVPLVALRVLAKVGDAITKIRGKEFPFSTIALDKLAGSAAYSCDLIMKELNYSPKWSLEDGLRQILEETVE